MTTCGIEHVTVISRAVLLQYISTSVLVRPPPSNAPLFYRAAAVYIKAIRQEHPRPLSISLAGKTHSFGFSALGQ
jgi:hypothetical protein